MKIYCYFLLRVGLLYQLRDISYTFITHCHMALLLNEEQQMYLSDMYACQYVCVCVCQYVCVYMYVSMCVCSV